MNFSVNVGMVIFAASWGLVGARAQAVSFCDLVPASAVASTLGITVVLVAKPDADDPNRCDYKGQGNSPSVDVVALSTLDAGFTKTLADSRFANMSSSAGEERVSGIGDAAIYWNRVNLQLGMLIRTKGKYVTFTVSTYNAKGLPKDAILSLGRLIVSKPLDTLKYPQS